MYLTKIELEILDLELRQILEYAHEIADPEGRTNSLARIREKVQDELNRREDKSRHTFRVRKSKWDRFRDKKDDL